MEIVSQARDYSYTSKDSVRSRNLTLLALALGSFSIGTSEFASMGIIQLFSESLGVSIPDASSAIAAYAFGVVIGAPLVTDVVKLSPEMIPVALALFGIGMTVGNIYGGRLADRYPARGIVIGFSVTLFILATLAIGGTTPWIFFPAMFGVGAAMMAAIPTIQVRLTRFAPEAPSLMGAMNLASLNVANAIGAWAGGLAVGAGAGLLCAAWAGFAVTFLGLLVLGLTMLNRRG